MCVWERERTPVCVWKILAPVLQKHELCLYSMLACPWQSRIWCISNIIFPVCGGRLALVCLTCCCFLYIKQTFHCLFCNNRNLPISLNYFKCEFLGILKCGWHSPNQTEVFLEANEENNLSFVRKKGVGGGDKKFAMYQMQSLLKACLPGWKMGVQMLCATCVWVPIQDVHMCLF